MPFCLQNTNSSSETQARAVIFKHIVKKQPPGFAVKYANSLKLYSKTLIQEVWMNSGICIFINSPCDYGSDHSKSMVWENVACILDFCNFFLKLQTAIIQIMLLKSKTLMLWNYRRRQWQVPHHVLCGANRWLTDPVMSMEFSKYFRDVVTVH